MNESVKSAFRRMRSRIYRGLVPRAVQIRADIWRSYRRAPKIGFVFIHVTRTGGTAVAEANYGHRLVHIPASALDAYAPRRIANLPRFAIVRDPVDRALSAFRFVCSRGAEVELDWRSEYVQFASSSADWFVREWLYARRGRLLTLDPLFWPQSAFTHSSAEERCVDYVLSFEHLKRDWSMLPFPVKWPERRINSLEGPPMQLSEHARALLRDIYSADYRLFPGKFGT